MCIRDRTVCIRLFVRYHTHHTRAQVKWSIKALGHVVVHALRPYTLHWLMRSWLKNKSLCELRHREREQNRAGKMNEGMVQQTN